MDNAYHPVTIGGNLIDADSGETIAESVNGEYRSADVLGWLGY